MVSISTSCFVPMDADIDRNLLHLLWKHRCCLDALVHLLTITASLQTGDLFMFHPVKGSNGAVFWEKANHDISAGNRSSDP